MMDQAAVRASPWRSALYRAAIVEAVLVAILVMLALGFIPGFGGADNPLWFYLAAALQFPASLLVLVVGTASAQLDSASGLYVTASVVVVAEFLILAMCFRLFVRS